MSKDERLPVAAKWYEPEDYLGINWKPEGKRHHNNLMPEPYEEIDEKEFLSLLLCGDMSLAGINYRQVFLPDEKGQRPVHFFLFHNKCIAATTNYEYDWSKDKGKGIEVGRRKESYYKLRFFRIGCNHEMKEVTHDYARKELGLGGKFWDRFDHVYHCEKCGYYRVVNSSD